MDVVAVDDPTRRSGGQLHPGDVVAVEKIEVGVRERQEFDCACVEPCTSSRVVDLVVAVRIDRRRIDVGGGGSSIRLLVSGCVFVIEQTAVTEAVRECEDARVVTVSVGDGALPPHELDHQSSVLPLRRLTRVVLCPLTDRQTRWRPKPMSPSEPAEDELLEYVPHHSYRSGGRFPGLASDALEKRTLRSLVLTTFNVGERVRGHGPTRADGFQPAEAVAEAHWPRRSLDQLQ